MPLSYTLAFPLRFGAIGFIIGGMVGMLSAAVMMGLRLRTLSRRYESKTPIIQTSQTSI